MLVESIEHSGAPSVKSTLHISTTEATSAGEYSLSHTARPGDRMVISWGSDFYRLVVPYIATSSITPEVPAGKDLYILSGATFTVNSNMSLHNVSVYDGATLNIASGKTLTVDTLIVRTEGDQTAPSVNITGTLSTEVIYHDKRIDDSRYYLMTLPFNSTLGDMRFSGLIPGNITPVYYTDYYIKYYDGVQRAADANDGKPMGKYWTKVAADNASASTYTIPAGKGYEIGVKDDATHKKRTLRFKMNVNAAQINEEKSSKTIVIEPSKVTTGDENADRHSGWNLIGNPYMHTYLPGSVTSGSGIKTGHYEMNDKGQWVIADDAENTVPYLTIYNPSIEDYYQTRAREASMIPFSAVFVQVEDNNLMMFTNPLNTGSAMPAYRITKAKEPVTYTGIYLNNEQDNNSDRTGLVISDRYTTNYEIGGDLMKMRNSNHLALYSITGNTELAFNAIDSAYASKVIPLGVNLPQDGEYSFVFDDAYNIEDVREVLLTDYQENITTNLLWEDYYFTAKRGNDVTRFAIAITLPKKSPSITTDIDETETELHCYATPEGIVTANISEAYDIHVFDMTGKKVASMTNVTGKQHIRLANGIYNVLVSTQSEQHTQRCIVR